MIVIAEYSGNLEIYTDVESVEKRRDEVLITPSGPSAAFERLSVIPTPPGSNIDIDNDDIEAMIRDWFDEECQRMADERIEEYQSKQE